ncbi:MAG TPA: hypothetical protein VMF65_00545 [Acidimicrobiales bacterium]|nr:hypothetical protein [Acidimicrobiales bacterium]
MRLVPRGQSETGSLRLAELAGDGDVVADCAPAVGAAEAGAVGGVVEDRGGEDGGGEDGGGEDRGGGAETAEAGCGVGLAGALGGAG